MPQMVSSMTARSVDKVTGNVHHVPSNVEVEVELSHSKAFGEWSIKTQIIISESFKVVNIFCVEHIRMSTYRFS